MKYKKTLYFLIVLAMLVLPAWGLMYSKVKPGVEALKDQRFPIHMKVDFGPANKPVYEGEVEIVSGVTPKDAVSIVFPIMSGETCCSPRELNQIDGVRSNKETKQFWTCWVNGSKNISPFKYQLKRGDKVEWIFIQDD